jgi:2-keto-4-pentenoate hydratase
VYGAVPEPDRCAAAASSSLEAVSWLGSRLVLEGRAPQRGTLLVSPAVGGHVELAPNLRITADFGPLGTLELRTAG